MTAVYSFNQSISKLYPAFNIHSQRV